MDRARQSNGKTAAKSGVAALAGQVVSGGIAGSNPELAPLAIPLGAAVTSALVTAGSVARDRLEHEEEPLGRLFWSLFSLLG